MAELDLTFDGDGRAITDLGSAFDSIIQLASAPGGKILAVGNNISNTVITRYNADGSLDTSFGTAGKITTEITNIDTNILVTNDGKIIVAGRGSDNKGYVIRYLADGRIDTSFATAGKYSTQTSAYISDIYFRINATNASSDIIVNESLGFGLNPVSRAVLLDVNGQIKPFPIGGLTATEPFIFDSSTFSGLISSKTVNRTDPKVQNILNLLGEPLIDELRSRFSTAFFTGTKPQSDGSILLSFSGTPKSSGVILSVLSRFSADGKFDSSFGVNGLLKSPISRDSTDRSNPLVFDEKFDRTDGLYVTVYDFAAKAVSVSRYTKSGQADLTFGSNGKVTLPQSENLGGDPFKLVLSISFDNQSRVLISQRNTSDNFTDVFRLNSNGIIDNTFGSDGKLSLPSEATNNNYFSLSEVVLLDIDDRVLIGDRKNGDIIVSKYNVNGVGAVVTPLISFRPTGVYGSDPNYIDSIDPIFTINEDGTQINPVTLIRRGDPTQAVSVTIKLRDFTAQSPSDYNNADILVNFAANETSKTIIIPIVNDDLAEGTERFFLSLTSPTGGASLGNLTNVRVEIVDGDVVGIDRDFVGTDGSDVISAAGGNNNVIGLGGNDFLDSGAGNDILTGVNPNSSNPGIGEQDNLTGGTGSDRFILGDANNIYYDDRNITTDGSNDYARIVDFNPNEDKVQLQGLASNYILKNSGFGSNFSTKLYIDKPGSEPDELIADFGRNTTGLNLTSSAFQYVDLQNIIPGTLAFSRSDYSIKEDGTKIVAVTVNRSGGSDGTIGVTINLANGTAKAGEDYNTAPITVNFANGETSKIIEIPIVNDTVYEPNETVNLTLTNPTNGAALGSQKTAIVTILDDDAVPGVLSFGNTVYSFNENGVPAATVTIDRTGGSDGEVSGTVYLSDGTAIGTKDYNREALTVTFANGETTKTIVIPINNDSEIEPTETINLTLGNPLGGVAIDSKKNTAIVNILDDDIEINFSSGNYSINEGDSNVQITLVRTGKTVGKSTVTLRSSNGAATSPGDYIGTPIPVVFEVGEITKTVSIPIIDDKVFDPNETFSLFLEDRSDGVSLGGSQNTATVSIVDNEPQPPDLFVSSITAPVESLPGQTIDISWTVANKGGTTADGTWVDRLYLVNATTGAFVKSLGEFSFTGNIAVGASVDRIQSIDLPVDLNGDYKVVVTTDSKNTIAEGSQAELNNTTTDDQNVRIKLSAVPNLTVSSITAPLTAFSGQETSVKWTIANIGTGATNASGWNDSVYLSADRVFDTTDIELGSVANPSYLNAGDSYSNNLTVRLPRGINGKYYFLVQSDAGNRVIEVGNEGDNFGSSDPITVNLTPPPDLQVAAVNTPKSAFSGQPIDLSWTVTNKGTGNTLEKAWTDTVYMSADETLDASDRSLGNFTHTGTLNVGASYTGSAKVNLPIGVSGQQFFFVKTDVDNQVYEYILVGNQVYEFILEDNNTNHNAIPTNIVLTPPPDLEIESLTVPSTARAGGDLSINYKVSNLGATETPDSTWADTFYLSTDDVFDPKTDLKLGSVNRYGMLDAGDSYHRTASFTLGDTVTGSYYVFGVTDSEDRVFELDNANNILKSTTQVSIGSQPADLVVTSAIFPTTGAAGKTIPVQWTVKNQGVGDTIITSWKDRVVASTNNILGDADDVTLGTFTRTGLLAANGTYSRTENISLPFNLEGNYQLFVDTDSGNKVYEGSNEGNNNFNVNADPKTPPVTVSRQTPDLQVTAIDLPATAQSGTSIDLSWTVKNSGVGKTNSTSWDDEVYLSLDTKIGSEDIKLGSIFHAGALDPAGSYTASGKFNLPVDLIGNYNVLVRTDRDNVVLEGALENNNDKVSTSQIDIGLSPVADLTVQSVKVAEKGIAGQPLNLTWTVKNNGVNTSQNWYDAVYLSRDKVFDRSTDIYLGYLDRTGGLNSGESYTATQSFKVPRGLAGNYYAFVATDSINQVFERNGESNNINFDGLSTEITLPTPADLVVGTISIPTNVTPGQNATISYTVNNQGANAAMGTWEDTIYISKDDKWDINDAFFGRVSHRGDVSAGGSYSQTLTANLPGLATGNYNVIVRSDILNNLPETNETNNIGASLDKFAFDVEKLVVGTPDTGTLGQGQSVYYRVDVAEGQTLAINFDSKSAAAANELYIRYGDVPSRNQFDFGFTEAFSPDQKLVVPTTKAGTYYVLAYGQNVTEAAPSFSVDAKLLDFEISSVSTHTGGNAGKVTVQISGAKFDNRTILTLKDKKTGKEIATSRVDLLDSMKLYATFDLRGANVGDYDVVAKNAKNQVSTLQNNFAVVAGGKGNLVTKIIAPSATRPDTVIPITIQFTNSGNNDLDTPLAVLTSDTKAPISLVREDLLNQTSLEMILQADNSPVGVLAPGATGSITFYANALSSLSSLQFSLSALDDPTASLNWDSFINNVESQSPESFGDPTVTANFWKTFRASVGETVGDIQTNLLKVQQLSLLVKRHEAEISGIPFSEKDYPTVSLGDLYSIASFAASYGASQPVLTATTFANNLDTEAPPTIETIENQMVLSLNNDTSALILGESSTTLQDKTLYDSDGYPLRFIAGTNVYFNVWKNGERVEGGTVNPLNKTYIIIHGFDGTGGNPSNKYSPNVWMADMANSLKQREPDSNVILVDWENGASFFAGSTYISPAETTDFLGDAVGQYIIGRGYEVSKLTLIGHSLGAQTAGDAGEYLLTKGKIVSSIIGLDAAAPLFEGKPNIDILDASDANNVIGIHTSLGNPDPTKTLLTGYGFAAPFAHQDLYVNPVRSESSKLLDYDHVGGSGLSPKYDHGYAIRFLNRLLAGEVIVDPNSKKELTWETLNNNASYTDIIPRSSIYPSGKVWNFQERNPGVNLTPKAIKENSVEGTPIGEFTVKEESEVREIQYKLLDSAGGRFRLDGNKLVVNNGSLLDYETAASHSITVETKARLLINGDYVITEPLIKEFTVQILDVDETDPNNQDGSGGNGTLKPKPKPDRQTTIPIVRATDPNDIIGPNGFGDDKWITPQTLPYTIRFENVATATAPAQTVTITQNLDPDLDFRTFRLGSFGWGGLTFDVPANRSFYSQRLDLTAKYGFAVDVFAGLDIKKGQIFWIISTVDPTTGEPPADPLSGFLPPNIANGVGDGFVNYTINPLKTAKTGDVIDAEATIIFDTEEPINTPRIFNTLDVSKPTSTVEVLAKTTATPEFLVSWTGTDTGSALASYTIYVSTNDGDFIPWISDTTLTESTYFGTAGNTYKFSAVATDNAGNTEDLPLTAQSQIRTSGGVATIGNFVWLDNNADGIQNSGELGLANVTVNLYNSSANLVTTTITKADGSYSFTNIPTDDYTVEVVAPKDHLFSDAKQGINTALNSDVNPQTGKTESFFANVGDNLSVDAGLFQLASITGQVWQDLDNDGVKDTNESVLKDWKIYLDTNTNGKLDTGETSTLTDATGNYSFTNLRPGTYTIAEEIQTGWKQTYPGVSITTTGSDIQLNSPSSPLISSDTYTTTTATNPIGLDKFWADSRFANIKGQGYSTVIIDTGIDVDNPLFGADANNNGIADKIVYQYDFADNDTDASDKNNHGSHIASIASSVAPGANLIILKVFKDSGTGSFADLEKALQWVNQNTSTYNIASVNLSLGDGQNWNTSLSRYGIGDELAAIASQNILISAAAGNNFYSYNSAIGLAYPAIDPSVISVGAVWTDNFGSRTFSNGAADYSTTGDAIASFSQRSPLLNVFAPGILITGANATGGTITMGGTSQAAPYISAIATLAEQIAQTYLGRKLSLAEFRALLATTSDPIIDGDNENDNVTNTGTSYPRINVKSLAEGILKLSPIAITPTPTTPTSNGTNTSLQLPDNNNLNLVHKVTLISGQIAKDLNFGNQQIESLPSLPQIAISSNNTDVAEPATPGKFTLTRTGAITQALSVNYILSGTATNGVDYQTLNGKVTFKAGENTASIDLNIIDDKIYEGTETVTLTLDSNPNYTLDPAKSGTISIADNDPQTPQLTQLTQNLLEIVGGTEKSLLKFTKLPRTGTSKDEIAAFVVDDAQGGINGILPGDKNYLAAALNRSQVVFSSLGNSAIDRQFDGNSQRYLNFTPGDRLQFLLVADDTLDSVKANLTNGKPTPTVLFSLPTANPNNSNQTQFTALPNNGGYQIAWANQLGDGKTAISNFNDLVLKVDAIDNFTPPAGTNLQGKLAGEVIDLRSFAGKNLRVDISTVSDAAYNNFIGFYAVEDTLGTLANGLKPGDVGYAEAAIRSAVLRSSKNETNSDLTIAGGKIFAPVVIANSTFENFLAVNPQNKAEGNIHAYFNYLGANTDGVDHFRLLGDNKFGVEDLYGGGDRDYNDLIVQMTIKS